MTELLASHGPEVRALLEPAVVNAEPVVEAVTEAVAPSGENSVALVEVASNHGFNNEAK